MRIGAYWAGCNNVGDKLTEAILNSLDGIDVYKEDKEYAKMVGVGSILERFQGKPLFNRNYPLYVFGTGYDWHYVGKEDFSRRLKVYAVRGEYTKEYVEKITGKRMKNVVLGDIGLLAGVLAPKEQVKKRYDLGIVPHLVDLNDRRFKELASRIPNSKIINVHLNPKQFVKQLLECRCVISTAMHPLIVCDALRIPNLWAYLPNANQVDMSHKFNDYYSVFDMQMEPFILDEKGLKSDIVFIINRDYRITDGMISEKVIELKLALEKMLEDMKKDKVRDIFWKIVGIGRRWYQRICEGSNIKFSEKAKGTKYASLGKNVDIVDASNIHNKENVKIGNNVRIGERAYIWGIGGIEIGDNTILGPRVTIHTSNHRYENAELLPYDNVTYLQKVKIGRNVWIGDGAMLCPGCEIGDGAVVAMGSVVSGKVPKCAVVAGNPAKVIKMRDKERYESLEKAGKYYMLEKRKHHIRTKYIEK